MEPQRAPFPSDTHAHHTAPLSQTFKLEHFTRPSGIDSCPFRGLCASCTEGVTARQLCESLPSLERIHADAAIPRLRIDQMIEIGWKGLLALSFINLILTAVLVGVIA